MEKSKNTKFPLPQAKSAERNSTQAFYCVFRISFKVSTISSIVRHVVAVLTDKVRVGLVVVDICSVSVINPEIAACLRNASNPIFYIFVSVKQHRPMIYQNIFSHCRGILMSKCTCIKNMSHIPPCINLLQESCNVIPPPTLQTLCLRALTSVPSVAGRVSFVSCCEEDQVDQSGHGYAPFQSATPPSNLITFVISLHHLFCHFSHIPEDTHSGGSSCCDQLLGCSQSHGKWQAPLHFKDQ